MKKLNPNKLLLSKWTSAVPKNREKHFIVIELIKDDKENVIELVLEAVYNKNTYTMPWQTLQQTQWLQGWK